MTHQEAQRQIAAILAQLEEDSDALVESLSVAALDASTISSERREMKMLVTIEMTRRPGHDWMVD